MSKGTFVLCGGAAYHHLVPRISEQRRAQRREQVLQAAIRCVIRSGFQGLTMAEVIAEAGLSAGAVYGYFASKDEMLAAVAERQLGGMAHLVEAAALADPLPAPAQLLEALVGRLLGLAEDPQGDLTVAVVQIWGAAVLGGEVFDILAPRIQQLLNALTELSRRWAQQGMIAGDVDPQLSARVLLALLPGYLLQRLVVGQVPAADFAAGLRALTTPPAPR